MAAWPRCRWVVWSRFVASMVTPDQVSVGVLVTAVPRDAVDEAVAACGVGARRAGGKLPPHVTAYLTLAMSLFPDDDYAEVAQKVTGSLDRFGCWDAAWAPPSASGITQARKRLGRMVMAEVFERVAGQVATLSTRGAWLRGRLLLAIDGFDVDVPDTEENAAEFGYAGTGEKRSAFPKIRVVALAECGTHAFRAAEVGGWAAGERTLARGLLMRLNRDEVLTADRGFYSFDNWALAAGTGADLIWRAPTGLNLPVVRVLSDGTFLTVLINPEITGGRRRERLLAAAKAGDELDPDEAHLARVVEYDIPDRAGNGTGELVVVLTTILDPRQARADEVAAGYNERWEEETANDQLKTHLRGPGRVLRSRLPDLAVQEMWAWLIVQYALTALIAGAAEAAEIDPDRVGFARTLRLVRRSATGTADISP
ncbi:transposase IS4 family protein [Parafrankia sp. EAN1pec]|nr:transposase IS4 family protein [Frankia sp. EAN1pec]ABW12494.1 transposase IS4 family protein [Frankia sp. EAN1pec]ABW13143.1 transposase IS4 family protein [Frankia sp. EAN1pec]ABW14188.1 transposase IS4 family protein [Frankia sp. EAN1pec]ABW14890.1 transposase IS4 family protein [Frankia sp. EAN1pec]